MQGEAGGVAQAAGVDATVGPVEVKGEHGRPLGVDLAAKITSRADGYVNPLVDLVEGEGAGRVNIFDWCWGFVAGFAALVDVVGGG